MPKILPITELRNTTDVSNLCHSSDEPIFITKNGYGDLVIMSMDAYDDLLATINTDSRIAEAEAEIKSGEPLLKAEDVFADLRRKHFETV